MYQLTSQTILDKECYVSAVAINKKPEGPLAAITKQIHTQQVSPFQGFPGLCGRYVPCRYVIMDPEDTTKYLHYNDIAMLFSFLVDNGYEIDTRLTKMMKTDLPQLICFIKLIAP